MTIIKALILTLAVGLVSIAAAKSQSGGDANSRTVLVSQNKPIRFEVGQLAGGEGLVWAFDEDVVVRLKIYTNPSHYEYLDAVGSDVASIPISLEKARELTEALSGTSYGCPKVVEIDPEFGNLTVSQCSQPMYSRWK